MCSVADPGACQLDDDANSEHLVSGQVVIQQHGDHVHWKVQDGADCTTHDHPRHADLIGFSHRGRDGSKRDNQHSIVEESTEEDSEDDPPVRSCFEFQLDLADVQPGVILDGILFTLLLLLDKRTDIRVT